MRRLELGDAYESSASEHSPVQSDNDETYGEESEDVLCAVECADEVAQETLVHTRLGDATRRTYYTVRIVLYWYSVEVSVRIYALGVIDPCNRASR